MFPDPSQSNQLRPDSSYAFGRGGQIAVVALVAVATSTALLNVPALRMDERWLAFLLVMAVFTALATQFEGLLGGWIPMGIRLIGQAVAMLALTLMSDYYFLVTFLSFITVSQSQIDLPRRWANAFDAALLGAIIVVYAIAVGWSAAIQAGMAFGAGFIFIIVFTRTAQREREAREQIETLYRDLERANAQLAEYTGQVEQLATMRERTRLARDVHDSLAHYLTVINVQLEIVTKLIDADPNRARDAALKAKQLASEGLAEVRRSVAALRPSPLDDRPLPDAIRGLLDDARDAGLIVSFDQVGSARPLSPEIETVLFRAAQESLTNIRKHARASSAGVRLAFETEAVRLRVRDNGIGRQGDPDNVGLSALRERVAALNGSVVAENHPDGGFLLEVALPYPDVSLGAAKNLIHNTADPSLTALPFK